MKCPYCRTDVIELSNKKLRGGILFCPYCKKVSPFAETTTGSMSLWEQEAKKCPV